MHGGVGTVARVIKFLLSSQTFLFLFFYCDGKRTSREYTERKCWANNERSGKTECMLGIIDNGIWSTVDE